MLPAFQITEMLVGSRLVGDAGLGDRVKRSESDDLAVNADTRKVWSSVFFPGYPSSSLDTFSAGFIRHMHFPVFTVFFQTRETEVAPPIVVDDAVDVIAQLSGYEISSDHSGQNDPAQMLPFSAFITTWDRPVLPTNVPLLMIVPPRHNKQFGIDDVDGNNELSISFPSHKKPPMIDVNDDGLHSTHRETR